MSQHFIDAIAPEHTVMVGFDRPLKNFFGTVFGAGGVHGEVIHWVPAASTVDELVAEMAPFAAINEQLQETLNDEIRNAATHPITKRVDHRTHPR
jgi:hypothetical protein